MNLPPAVREVQTALALVRNPSPAMSAAAAEYLKARADLAADMRQIRDNLFDPCTEAEAALQLALVAQSVGRARGAWQHLLAQWPSPSC